VNRRLLVLLAVSACAGPTVPAASPSATSVPSPSQAVVTPSPTPVATPSAHPASTATATASEFRGSVRRVTAADLPSSWRPGCPVGPSQLRLLTLRYHDFTGARRTGELVVHARVADQVVRVFKTLYDEGFPIRSLRLVDEFGGDDDRSMAADNTSGFNCRNAVGGSGWSQHAYGLAIDINPRENPYVYGGQVLPPEGRAYLDRSDHRRGTAYRGSVVNRAFAAAGWSWGGVWRNPDYQHFSKGGS